MAKSIFVAFLLVVCLALLSTASAHTDEKGNHCFCPNSKEYNLVCGTDGVTYVNPGAIKCQNKCKKTKIAIKHHGKC